MTTAIDVYESVCKLMCKHCNRSLRIKCAGLPESTRFKTVIICMGNILKRVDEEYPIRLPETGKKL
jgi:hypothetical protein